MRRLLLLATVVLAIAARAAAGSLQSDVDPERVLAQADALVAKGAFGEMRGLLSPLEGEPQLSPRQKARLQLLLGRERFEAAQYSEALRRADIAEPLAQSLNDAALLAQVETLRGVTKRRQGAPLEAVRHYEARLRWSEASGDRRLVAGAYAALSGAHQDLGDWSRVLHYANRAFEADPNPTDFIRYRYQLQKGIAHYEFHDRDEAAAAFAEALAIAERTGDRGGMSMSLGELGLVAWELDRDRDRALEHYARALAIAREDRIPELQVTWLLNAGNVFRDTGDLTEALRRYRQAFTIADRTTQPRVRTTLLKSIGQTHRLAGNRREAEAFLAEAMTAADEQDASRIRWESRLELALLHAASDPERAGRLFAECLDVVEAANSNILLEGFRAGALSLTLARYDPYDEYIRFLLDRDDARQAFVVAERARARAFLDTLTTAREQIAATAPAPFVDGERDLLRRISSHQARLRAGRLDGTTPQEITAALKNDEEALTALRLKLAAEQPTLAEARYPRLPSLDELQRGVLRAGDALLFFFVGRTGSAAWLVTPKSIETVRLPSGADLAPPIRAYLETLAQSSGSIDAESGSRVYRLLGLDPLARLPDGGRLVVMPHGILNYLPFEAVMDPGGRYLVERHAVSYSPSASSYAYLRSQRREPGDRDSVVAVGNPVTTGSATAAAERGLRADRVDLLKPLAHAGRELRDVAAMFGRRGRVLDREHATESALVAADFQHAAILHFATHGLIDEERPERSALALTAQPPESDGLLQMREIYGLRLRAALVTLSACQTALGKDVSGEGIVGLARAFFYAGANAVMASLWNVNDASTAQFMTAFYERLSSGDSIDRAAREAKLRFLRGDDLKLRHPYYWAPFIVSGNAAAVVPVRDGVMTALSLLGWATVAGGVVMAAGYVIVRRRRARTLATPTA